MPLETRFEICTPEDTARALVCAINTIDVLDKRIFNLGGGESCCISYKEFLEKSFRMYGLGNLNFPNYAFAERNFHCGRMADGDELEKILHFRNDTFETYFERTAKSVPFSLKFLVSLFRPFIKWALLLQSEPYRAYRTKDKKMLNHFFKTIHA